MAARKTSLAEYPALSLEAELLLCCACLQPTADQRDRIAQLLARDLDWISLLELAAVHGLRPLVFLHLGERLPKLIYAELWSQQQLLRRRNKIMAAELIAILQFLDEHDIPAIPYKGPVLAARVYGDLALRVYGDLDLLLRPGDILQAKALLETRGYQPHYPMAPAVEAGLANSRMHYHLALKRDQPAILVELHWKTDAEFPVESSDTCWWSNLPTARFEGQDVKAFSPSELLLVLCLHGSKHFWASLGWLVDVAELIRQQPTLDWAWIIARAESQNAGRRLAYGLHLMEVLLRVELPDVVRSWLATQIEAKRIALASIPGLLDPDTPMPGAFKRMKLNFALYETGRQRLIHATDVVLMPGLVEWTGWSLPGPLSALYLPLRWARLAWKYASASFRRN